MTVGQRLVIAGGLGSGKSTVGRMLENLGWGVIDTDTIGRAVLREPPVVREVGRRWPAVTKRGAVDRAILAGQVFRNPLQLRKLEEIVHPRVTEDVDLWLKTAGRRTAVQVSAQRLLRPEWGRVAVVFAPVALRIERAVARGMDAEDVARRIAAQLSDRELLDRADVVIDNSGSEHMLELAVRRLDRFSL